MKKLINGIHHITALAGDPQRNLDFYTGVLGLRLVKKTINFDAPDTYHFYYGDEVGNPGTILTFFPFADMQAGRKGNGQLTQTAFSIPDNSILYWMERLDKYNINYKNPQEKFGETYISLEDPDGLGIELIATSKDTRAGYLGSSIPAEHTIRGIHSVTLSEKMHEKTALMLTGLLGHQLFAQKDNIFRYVIPGNDLQFVDIAHNTDAQPGHSGTGTVHHIAFATDTDDTQLLMRAEIASAGYPVSPVLDRDYFHSIYFREPGGVLFEVATLPPGFAVDEDPEHLGEALKLPAWVEAEREEIVKALIPVTLNTENYA